MMMPFIEIVCWFRLLSQLTGQLRGQKEAYNTWISELTLTCAVDEWNFYFVVVRLLKLFFNIGVFSAESQWGAFLETQTENYILSLYFCKS